MESFNKSLTALSNAIASQKENLNKLIVGGNARFADSREFTDEQISIMSLISGDIY